MRTMRHVVSLATMFMAVAYGTSDPPPYFWQDCWLEIPEADRSTTTLLKWVNISSVPPVVRYGDQQVILKDVQVQNVDPTSETQPTTQKVLMTIHQYYKLFDKWWMTFLVLHNVDACKEHAGFCPLPPLHSIVHLRTNHPPLVYFTPYGWYRSRQTYYDAATNKVIGCADMQFQYRSRDWKP